ncbi:4'-phosphopantetheinyl transferase family protein [Acinetobacter gerneri]|uniref:4'-phosphopantetheinyl transferase family protein n=1 Tax=Acinetobacter gerneri TaxID=202952 RepID=UPI0028AFBAA7|nr:4'-phosphopantetheinyl transferase superfamily protein [Acinetobacter gerneri]
MFKHFINTGIRCALPNKFITSQKLLYEPNSELYLTLCEFNPKNFNLNLFDELSIQLPKQFLEYSNIRQREFLAGRYAAKLALSAIYENNWIDQVKIGRRREPIFPDDLLGTLTHSKTIAICAVTPSKTIGFIGVDIEPIMQGDDLLGIAEKVFSSRELDLLLSKGINKEVAATLIFSAKESVFKAISKKISQDFFFNQFELYQVHVYGNSITMKMDITNTHLNSHIIVSAKLYKKHVLTLVAQ